MSKKTRVGILFNARENLFKEYLEWIIQEHESKSLFDLIGVHSNDKSIFNKLETNKSFEEIIESSDVVFSFGYWKIIDKEVIDRVPIGIVNFHNSHNLKYKGRNCSTHVIKNKEKYHGSTIHFINEKVDEGDIIATRSFLLSNDMTAEDVFVSASNLGFELLKENFYKIIGKEKIKFLNTENEKTYLYKKKDLNHNISVEKLSNQKELLREIRSLTFDNKPAPYIFLDGVKVYLKMENYDSGVLEKHPFNKLHREITSKINSKTTRSSFQKSQPFKHIIIDNFLPDNIANSILSQFPNIEDDAWTVGYDENNQPIKYSKDNPFERKMVAISDSTKFPSFHKHIFEYFDSDCFLDFLKDITGIKNLRVDTTGRHAGLRGMLNGSHQHVHSDATIHPETGLRKRLSVILYLNKSWSLEKGGFLEMWDDDMEKCVNKISPDFNRLVIFECTDKSFHGVPETIKLEDGSEMRKSLILSYMSDQDGSVEERKRALFVARPNDRKDKEMEDLRRERASIDQKNRHRFV